MTDKRVRSAVNAQPKRVGVIAGAIALVVFAVAVVVGIVLANGDGTPAPVTVVKAEYNGTREGGVVVSGSPTAKFTMDLYADYLCPHCQKLEASMGNKFTERVNAGELRIRFHMLPMLNAWTRPAGYSSRAANAALCAADAGRFMPLHHELFAQQPPERGPGLNDQQVIELAKGAGLADSAFVNCVTGNAHAADVDATWAQAQAEPIVAAPGENGTPRFAGTPQIVINGKKINTGSDTWFEDALR
ncbi:hypothetical protein D5S17_19055 [Pseudonocardiaceae bacterium YIM PH 21723]|nr:hypothetical protein D5S17_19055 [Pseudonocardiaceae bacterium YIM PH 21723]